MEFPGWESKKGRNLQLGSLLEISVIGCGCAPNCIVRILVHVFPSSNNSLCLPIVTFRCSWIHGQSTSHPGGMGHHQRNCQCQPSYPGRSGSGRLTPGTAHHQEHCRHIRHSHPLVGGLCHFKISATL